MLNDNYIIEENSRYFLNDKTQNLALDVMLSPYPIIQGDGETAFVFYFKLSFGNAKNWFDKNKNYNNNYFRIKEQQSSVFEWAFPGVEEDIDIQIPIVNIALDVNNRKECMESNLVLTNNNFIFQKNKYNNYFHPGNWTYHTINSKCIYKDQPNILTYQINYSDKFLDKTSGKIIINDIYNNHLNENKIIGIEKYTNIYDINSNNPLDYDESEVKINSLYQQCNSEYYATIDILPNGNFHNNYIKSIADFSVSFVWIDSMGSFADVETFWNYFDKIRTSMVELISNFQLTNVQVESEINPMDFKNIEAHIEYDNQKDMGTIVIDTSTQYNKLNNKLEISGNEKGIEMPATDFSSYIFNFDIEPLFTKYTVKINNNNYFHISDILISDENKTNWLNLYETWYLNIYQLVNYFNIEFNLKEYKNFLEDVQNE
ncbi:hypothetical protein [Spiroplasma endosymbiont of Amphibalanus improvisus]|uniref:hypothetical protein n=1 Tax=Spiroplasma endosymbiont of Amphibalanus improvisus TaxID=3066327 RepID=UPI00313EA01B